MAANKTRFEPFQKVLVRRNMVWKCDLYSHYEDGWHFTLTQCFIPSGNVIPYEGHEDYVGTLKTLPIWEVNQILGEC